jgi:hypothetical protein
MEEQSHPPVFDPAWTTGGWVYKSTVVQLKGGQANRLADGNAHRIVAWVTGSISSYAMLGFGPEVSSNGGIYIAPVSGKGVFELSWSVHGGAVQLPIYIYPNDFGTISWTLTEILWLPTGV